MQSAASIVGKYAPDFELPGINDEVHHLRSYLDRYAGVGVVFMCNHCPYVQASLDRLKQIQARFEGQNFTLVGINPNDSQRYPEDSFENMKRFAAERGMNFPYLRDVTQDVAKCFQAQTTPHVFAIDSDGVVRYGGSIDDSPNDPNGVGTPYFETAIAQMLEGQTVDTSTTDPIGCSIKWNPE